MLNEICPQHVFLDKSKTLFFDKESSALFEWNEIKEELKPIKYDVALKKYKNNLNNPGESFFDYRHNDTRKAFLYNCLYTISISAAIATFFAGFIFAIDPDTKYGLLPRALVFFVGTIPGCLLYSYDVATSED
jgi:hypothetical protein